MVLLMTGMACGLFSCVCALILQFKLAPWLFLTGLHSLSAEKRTNIDLPRLRRRLSVLLYFLSACFVFGSLLQYLKVISGSIILPLYFLVILVVFDAVFFFYRKYDHNPYSDHAKKSARIFLFAVNLLLISLSLVFLR